MNDIPPLQGRELGGELEQLREAARVNLPRLSGYYAEAAGHLAGADLDNPWVDNTWYHVRDILWRALQDTSSNLWTVGETLGLALDAFTEDDTAAADVLESKRRQFEAEEDESGEEWTGGKPELPDDKPADPGGPMDS